VGFRDCERLAAGMGLLEISSRVIRSLRPAYLVDHISIHAAFLAQFVFLGLFSHTFIFPGFTGLAITIGAILTLFVSMQLTGRIRR
jgi:hypothetical protein